MSDAAAVPDHDGRRPGPGGADGAGYPSIIIQGSAMARIEAEMGADTGVEVGGVLVGNAAPSTNFVLVTASLPAPRPVEVEAPAPIDDVADVDTQAEVASQPAAAAFTFTAATLEDLARQVAATYPGQRIVGWYHSHPRFGIFLSAHDLYIQSAFFAQSWQVGYVYDPVQAQRGFFGWSGREVVRVPQWEVTSISHASGATLPVNAAVAGVAASDEALAPIEQAPGRIAIGEPAPSGGSTTSTGAPETKKKNRTVAVLIAAAVVIAAIVVAAIAFTGGDDDDSSSSTTDAPDTSSITTEQAAQETVATEASVVPGSDTATTVAETTTTAAAGDVTNTEPAPITFPATPTAVATPGGRVGSSATACTAEADGSYAPLSDCFVPLDNGNVMVFVSGSLRCVDPSGEVLANEAQTFTIGVEGDPIVLVADDALTPTCTDLTYAENVLAGGSDTLDGLCGSSGTQINDGTRRCFSQNRTNGAMVALVRGTADQDDLVASCTTDDAEPSLTDVEWSDDTVSTAWRVDSIVYQPASNDFVATASRNGAEATATISCG